MHSHAPLQFAVSDVSIPIAGIDLLQPRNLLMDTCERKLLDENNRLSVCRFSFSGCSLFPVTFKHIIDQYYQQILDKSPKCTKRDQTYRV